MLFLNIFLIKVKQTICLSRCHVSRYIKESKVNKRGSRCSMQKKSKLRGGRKGIKVNFLNNYANESAEINTQTDRKKIHVDLSAHCFVISKIVCFCVNI